jgi:hypothetical protein
MVSTVRWSCIGRVTRSFSSDPLDAMGNEPLAVMVGQ